MASLLLGCLGFTSSKFRAKRQAKKEREQEYVENFEALKEQNAHRVRQLSNQGSMESTLYDGRNGHAPEMEQHGGHRHGSVTQNSTAGHGLPKYDDIAEHTEPRTSG